jgi:hypothetical protein
VKHYIVTWAHNYPDDPVWMAYEVTDNGGVVRLIERFPNGRTELRNAAEEGCRNLLDAPFIPSEFDPSHPTVTLTEVTGEVFDHFWCEALG